MGSTRLPGKVLKKLGNKPLLWHVVNRLKCCKHIDNIVVATSLLPIDDSIESFCKKFNVDVFRGSELNVLTRFYMTSLKYSCDNIIRITGDCPVLDPQIIDQMINKHFEGGYEYSNIDAGNTFPRGLDAEIFSMDILKEMHVKAKLPRYREHVTLYINENKETYLINNYKCENEKQRKMLRLTVDTIEDYNLISNIYDHFSSRIIFYYEDIIMYLDKNKHLYRINSMIEQKIIE